MKQRKLAFLNSIHVMGFIAVAIMATMILSTDANAQTETALYTYPNTTSNDSGIVWPGLIAQGPDGDLYATIQTNGSTNEGSVFKMTTAGQYTLVYSFCAEAGRCTTTGANPDGGVTLGTDGNFYGTTQNGGANGEGTVYKLTPAGVWTKLWDFTEGVTGDEGFPSFAPLLGQDGNFYGVDPGDYNTDYGVFYKITPKGVLTPHKFDYTDGDLPILPVEGTDGNFYGTTKFGGDPTCRCGLAYKTTAAGAITALHIFKGYPTDGSLPISVLVQGNDGYYYGTTYSGGTHNLGTIFKISSAGAYTLLYSFDSVAGDATNPWTGLTLGTDGNLYGTTISGGKYNYGTIYQWTAAGSYSIVYSFCSIKGCSDGIYPETPLVQHTDGKFYGNASGNSLCCSAFYSFDMGLGPFARLVLRSGKVGAKIQILGQGFSGGASVSFNGVPATVTVTSDTYLAATVPVGALSGYVTVTTSTATLQSSQQFMVTPQITSSSATGTVGSSITITGVSLGQATRVTVGGKSATFKVNSDTQITATIPVGAKTGQKPSVTTPGGTVMSPTVLAIAPTISNFSPRGGAVGTSVTIKGNTFTGATAVTFGGVAATTFSVVSDIQMTATVPVGAITGPITITTPGGTGTSNISFTVEP